MAFDFPFITRLQRQLVFLIFYSLQFDVTLTHTIWSHVPKRMLKKPVMSCSTVSALVKKQIFLKKCYDPTLRLSRTDVTEPLPESQAGQGSDLQDFFFSMISYTDD